jgi:LPS sulfotransferase NodH
VKVDIEFIKNSKPVIILGMHRSGTSLLVRLLKSLGVYLGRDLSANAESLFFQSYNRSLLIRHRGRWDEVVRAARTLQQPEVIRRESEAIVRELFGNQKLFDFFAPRDLLLWKIGYREPIWGWKDPRNSICLPVWLDVFENAKVIYVVRDGIDVAISLSRRERKRKKSHLDYSGRLQDFSKCFGLWEEYNQICRENLAQLSGRRVFQLKYEDLLTRPEDKIAAVLSFVDRTQPLYKIEEVARTINRGRLNNEKFRKDFADEIDQLFRQKSVNNLCQSTSQFQL